MLGASLASCTAITLRMYADRKAWPLEQADVTANLTTDDENVTAITLSIQLHGQLSEEQRSRMMDIAQKCPIHRMLKQPIHIQTTLA